MQKGASRVKASAVAAEPLAVEGWQAHSEVDRLLRPHVSDSRVEPSHRGGKQVVLLAHKPDAFRNELHRGLEAAGYAVDLAPDYKGPCGGCSASRCRR
jgi:hypothetical protein